MAFDPLADLFSGFNTDASDVFERRRPCVGKGIYLLSNYGPKSTQDGTIIQAELMVAQPAPGSTRAPGDIVELAWFVYKGKKEGGDNEKARGREFVNALMGYPRGYHSGADALKLSQPTQPGMGTAILIEAEDVEYVKKGTDVKRKARNYTFGNIPQTLEQVAAQRAKMSSMTAAPAPEAPTAPVAPPSTLLNLFK